MVTVIHHRDIGRHHGRTLVRIDRGTPYGNPHRVGQCHYCVLRARIKTHHSREEAIEAFKTEWHSDRWETTRNRALQEIPPDAILVCWCTPKPCHGNIIAGWINAQRQATV